jgi:hypothetical protein
MTWDLMGLERGPVYGIVYKAFTPVVADHGGESDAPTVSAKRKSSVILTGEPVW